MKKFYYVLALLCVLAVSACTSKSQLELQVAAANKECPIYIEDGMKATKIMTEGNSVVYVIEVMEDEDFIVSDFRDPDVNDVMKAMMLMDLQNDSDPDIKDLLRLCREANYNLVYRFIGMLSGTSADIVLRASEL